MFVESARCAVASCPCPIETVVIAICKRSPELRRPSQSAAAVSCIQSSRGALQPCSARTPPFVRAVRVRQLYLVLMAWMRLSYISGRTLRRFARASTSVVGSAPSERMKSTIVCGSTSSATAATSSGRDSLNASPRHARTKSDTHTWHRRSRGRSLPPCARTSACNAGNGDAEGGGKGTQGSDGYAWRAGGRSHQSPVDTYAPDEEQHLPRAQRELEARCRALLRLGGVVPRLPRRSVRLHHLDHLRRKTPQHARSPAEAADAARAIRVGRGRCSSVPGPIRRTCLRAHTG